MKNRLLPLLFLLLAFAACRSGKRPAGENVLAVEVYGLDSTSPRSLVLNVSDPFCLAGRQAAPVGAQGETVRFCFTCSFPQYVTLRYGNRYAYLYAEPGDSLHVRLDAPRFAREGADALHFGGDGAELSRQTARWFDYRFKHLGQDYGAEREPAAFLAAARSRMASFADSLDAWAALNGMDGRIRDMALRDERCILAYMTSLTGSAAVEALRDPVFDLFDEANLRCLMDYSAAMNLYLFASAPEVSSALYEPGAGAQAVLRLARAIDADPRLQGRVRDWVLFDQLRGAAERHPALVDSLPGGLFADGAYEARLREAARMAGGVTPRSTVAVEGVLHLQPDGTLDTLPAGEMIGALAARYPGRVLYIDTWATWCGPCRKEIKNHTPALHRTLTGSGMAVPVNLCVLSTQKRWLEAVRELRFEGEHYFLPADASNLFMGAYSLGGVPTYMLVDKRGRIRSTSAPRPSAGADAIEAIRKLYEE